MPDFAKLNFLLIPMIFTSTLAECNGSDPTCNQSQQASYPSMVFLHINPSLIADQNVADVCFTPVTCPANAKYRTIDGSCNNAAKTWWGASNTPYVRLLKADYKDTDNNYRVSVVDGSDLPSARALTQGLLQQLTDKPDIFTRMFMSFGQLVAHDTLGNPRSQGSCCSPTGDAVLSTTNGCRPIVIPDDDPFYSPFGRKCLEYRQSDSVTNCSAQPNATTPLLPINRVTHFIDASIIYGVNEAEGQRLRTLSQGLLKTSSGTESGRTYLPKQDVSNCPFAKDVCYNGADARVNQNLDLAVSETIWLRFHNFLAGTIASLDRNLTDDEALFQETRRWVIAILQNIVYAEWLPKFLGVEYCTKLGLLPQTSGYATGYDPTVNPSSIADFAGAAFRTLHSYIPDFTSFSNATRTPFSATMERAGDFLEVADNYDGDIQDLVSTPEQVLDRYYSLEMLDHMIQFSTPTFNGSVKFGDDLAATDIQRGRDYGLRNYNIYRQLAGLPDFKTFDDISAAFGADISALLAKFYKSPDDIDYYIGSLVEATALGAGKAETLRVVWGEAFQRYKFGDSFFYEFSGNAGSFTPAQLQFIRGVKLSTIVCVGSDSIQSIQPDVFTMPDSGNNTPISCYTLARTFLDAFNASFNA